MMAMMKFLGYGHRVYIDNPPPLLLPFPSKTFLDIFEKQGWGGGRGEYIGFFKKIPPIHEKGRGVNIFYFINIIFECLRETNYEMKKKKNGKKRKGKKENFLEKEEQIYEKQG